MIEHPEEVYLSLCAVAIRQRVKEPEVFLEQGELPVSRVHCCAAALARAALVHISGATLCAACTHLVTLRVEFTRARKFLEGARSLEGSSVRNRCFLENFCLHFTP